MQELRLELEDCRQLQASWSTATQERVADAYVGSRADREILRSAITARGGARRTDVGNKSRQERIHEVGMIEQVKELGPEGHFQPLGDSCVLENGEVELLETGAVERVASFAAEVPCAWDAVGFVRCAWVLKRVPRAGRGEGRQVYVVKRVAGIVLRSRNLVWTIESFARTRVVSFELIVQMPGLTILQVEDAVQPPAVLQLLHRPAHPGELVDEVPGEAAANVVAGISLVATGVCAVRRLRLVGFEILRVAGIVDSMRPDKIDA